MIIDGTNIKSKFGVTILDNSYESLLQYPKLKEPQKNDWAEYDGLEVDLLTPVLDSKEVVLNVHCRNENIEDFLRFLMQKTYRTYEFEDLGLSFKLRFIAVVDFKKFYNSDYNFHCTELKLKLSDDDPTQCFEQKETSNVINFEKYGFTLLEGTNLESTNEVKQKLEIKSRFLSGVKVAEQVGKKKEYTATLKLFKHSSIGSFIESYYELLNDLTQPNELIIRGLKCYYQSSKINDFDLQGSDVWCAFDINVNII